MSKLIDCQFFRDRITHFQADEVSAEERTILQRHLDNCEACSMRLEFDEGLCRAIKTRLPRVPLPPGLETRIRASLSDAAPTPQSVVWFRRPWFATVAASALLAALVLVGSGEPRSLSLSSAVIQVTRQQVTVVDRDCERAGASIRQQRKCRNHQHLNMLRVANGEYWYVSLDQAAGKRILFDPNLRGQRMMVAGKLYPEIRTLRLTDYEALDVGGLSPASL